MDTPFDRRLRRLRRDRAAPRFAEADYLYRHAAEDLLDRLDSVTRSFTRVLDLGCAGGFLGGQLRKRGLEVVSADPGFLFARQAGGIVCDEDQLPFTDGAFDLVVCVGVLDSVNDLPGALTLIRRVLRPDGLFLGACAGAASLPRLRAAMLAADALSEGASPRIHPQIDVRSAGDLLARAGFTMPVTDSSGIDVRFPHLFALVADLRRMGATNILASRSRRPIARASLAAAAAHFAAAAEPDGKTVEHFDIIHLSGWAPSPDQPRPARRGSATASLAHTLKPPYGIK
jgi:NADH dehydrogenase [ubiquinone] 1 alpha subcomplex assembly factor 5